MGNALSTLPVGTTFDTIPRFDTSMTLISKSSDTFAFVNNFLNFSWKYNVVWGKNQWNIMALGELKLHVEIEK